MDRNRILGKQWRSGVMDVPAGNLTTILTGILLTVEYKSFGTDSLCVLAQVCLPSGSLIRLKVSTETPTATSFNVRITNEGPLTIVIPANTKLMWFASLA